jgi:NADH-quinone oxidoreductase subunit M
VANAAPVLSAIFMITTLASIGLPLLNNFVGEYLVLQGAALVEFKWAVFAALGVILSACYMLWLYQRTFLGEIAEDLKHHLYDLNKREILAIAPLVILMVWMGIATGPFLTPITAANAKILERSTVNVEFQVKSDAPGVMRYKEARSAR